MAWDDTRRDLKLRKKYTDDRINNAGDTGFNLKMLLSGPLTFKRGKYSGGKDRKTKKKIKIGKTGGASLWK